jgi:prolyl oligopeptidase
VQTTLDADNKRILAIDTRKPAREHWREVVPAGELPIDEAALIGHQLLVSTLRDAHSVLRAYDLSGKLLREAEPPGLGTLMGLDGTAQDTHAYYAFASFTEPRSVYRYDLASGASAAWKSPQLAFDRAAYETRQVFYPSSDAQKVPMFIVGKRGLIADQARPTILTGYGAGGVPATPYFDPLIIPWLERGGLLAVANVRGGGEYGEAWHRVAVREHKQVSVDDFQAAARWLSANGYTSVPQLGATGTSGGGFLVAAAAVQKPELFGAVVAIAGVYDLLRFQLFGEGAGWEADFGSAATQQGFHALAALSPLHSVRAQTAYPPMLIATSDHDVRVAPLHSFKLAAALQAAQSAQAPELLRVWTKTGHGRGATLSQRIEQNTEVISFFAHALQLPAAAL